jgi:hypothetical protein
MATPDLLFEIFGCNSCNIPKKTQMKHFKYASETLQKYLKTIAKHTQHPDKALATYV